MSIKCELFVLYKKRYLSAYKKKSCQMSVGTRRKNKNTVFSSSSLYETGVQYCTWIFYFVEGVNFFFRGEHHYTLLHRCGVIIIIIIKSCRDCYIFMSSAACIIHETRRTHTTKIKLGGWLYDCSIGLSTSAKNGNILPKLGSFICLSLI